jgi:hypothetical protein
MAETFGAGNRAMFYGADGYELVGVTTTMTTIVASPENGVGDYDNRARLHEGMPEAFVGYNEWAPELAVLQRDEDGLLYLHAPGTPYHGMLLVPPGTADAPDVPGERQVMLRRRA